MNNEDVPPGYGFPEQMIESIIFFETDEGTLRLLPPQNLHRNGPATSAVLENHFRGLERDGSQKSVDANSRIRSDASDLPKAPDILIQEVKKDILCYSVFHLFIILILSR
jgi:hypothetical protein